MRMGFNQPETSAMPGGDQSLDWLNQYLANPAAFDGRNQADRPRSLPQVPTTPTSGLPNLQPRSSLTPQEWEASRNEWAQSGDATDMDKFLIWLQSILPATP